MRNLGWIGDQARNVSSEHNPVNVNGISDRAGENNPAPRKFLPNPVNVNVNGFDRESGSDQSRRRFGFRFERIGEA